MNTTMAGRWCAADLGSGCGWTSVGLGLCEVNAPRLFVCTDLVLTFFAHLLCLREQYSPLVFIFVLKVSRESHYFSNAQLFGS